MFRTILIATVATFPTTCNLTFVDPNVTVEPVVPPEPYQVAEPLVSRLTDAQYEHTILDVLGVTLTAEEKGLLPPTETIPGRYSTNISGQNFADDFVVAYARIARSLAERLDSESLLMAYGGCDSVEPVCVEAFVDGLGLVLHRQPLDADEFDLYLRLSEAIQDVPEVEAPPAGGDECNTTGQCVAEYGATANDCVDSQSAQSVCWCGTDACTVLFPPEPVAGFTITDDHVVQGLVQAMLQSPRFLYRIETENDAPAGEVRELTGWELATRLSFFLWQSAPDAELLEFAEGPMGDGVYDRAELSVQLDRMMADPRFERTRTAFWGDYSLVSTASFSSVTPEVGEELRESMMASFERLFGVAGEGAPLTEVFDGSTMMMTPAVASIAGLPSLGDGLQPYLDVPDRVGLITHPAFLAAMGTTSFVGRGTFLTERLLCQHTGPPPSDPGTTGRIEDTEQATTGLTPREASEFRFQLEPLCLACHTQFEPIAYGFEPFDVSGEFGWTDDQGRALYSDGVMPAYGDRPEIPFATASELLTRLAVEPSVRRCFVENMMEFGHGARPGYLGPLLDDAQAEFEDDGATFEALVRSVATSPRMSYLRAVASP